MGVLGGRLMTGAVTQRYGRWIRSKSTWGYKESDIQTGDPSRPETIIGTATKGKDLTGKDLEKA
jgi:hypothetical protein